MPPYVVFHDPTLVEMVSLRPRTLHELANVSGVGRHKLNTYGQIFLDIIERVGEI